MTPPIGISTHFMPSTHGETLEDAIDMVREAGFNAFELVPTDGQAQFGFPYNHPNVGLWPREYSREQRKALKERFSGFECVTIHSPHLDLNIASSNRGIREESERQYRECMELAVDLGVEVVTFHPGRTTYGYIRSEEEILKYEIETGQRLLEFASEHGLTIGYECGQFKHLCRLLDALDGMGLNYDIGHGRMGGTDEKDWVEYFAGRIVEVHFNSACQYFGGILDHQPISRNNALDYQYLIPAIRDTGFTGPIICELQGNDIQQTIENCLEAKQLITGLWEGTLTLTERWRI